MDLRGSVDCVYFLKGQCRNGGSCPFKHDPAKLPLGVALSDGHAIAKQSEDCYYFLQGRCSKGDQCHFRHGKDKLMARISNSNIAPTSGVVAVAAPAPPSHALPPAKASSARPSVPGHVAVPNAKATDVQPSTDQLKIMHVPLDVKPGQRPSNLAGGIKILSAEPQPATCNPDDIRLLQTTQRKRKEQEDCINDNAGIPSLQPPTSQNKKVQRPAAVVEDVVFNAPKTIEEIRAEKKVKNSKAINTNEEPPVQSVPTVEDEDIDFDVDGVDDDFEAQMRALEDAL